VYFLSLLDLLEETGFQSPLIKLDDLLVRMLMNAWYPHVYFKLNFGVGDRIADALDNLGIEAEAVPLSARAHKTLEGLIRSRDYSSNHLLDMVPYRLLTPFFESQVRGIRDAKKNRLIVELAEDQFQALRPLYMFTPDLLAIVMHHDWMAYFQDNYGIVRAFAAWHFLDYMQRRNPSVPNIKDKLFPPLSRNSLSAQTGYWKTILKHTELKCIYSNQLLEPGDISLDHFIPWSFVAHDQMWNLIPVQSSINSSKSNRLPSIETYLSAFIDLQFTGIRTLKEHAGADSWKRISEPYISDLNIPPDKLLDKERFARALESTIIPLETIARNRGFSVGWVFREE
jgi:hypothetical protein